MNDPVKSRDWRCCEGGERIYVADCGHTQGVEFTLHRCSVCSRHWMSLWSVASSSVSYSSVDEPVLSQLLNMPEGRAARRLLEKLYDL
jgi:hypothetical protein